MISWKSSSDNFSCYDLSNTSSSNHGNLGSSSTSDSEDASQQSAGRDTSLYTQNGFSECQVKGKDKKQDVSGGVAPESQALFGHSPDGRGNKVSGNLLIKTAENFEDGKATALTSSQHQSMSTSMQNQHLQFLFQAPSAMGYYHQNPVSWPATPAN